MKTYMTERLILRPVTLKDAPAMFDYAKRPDVGPKAGWFPHHGIEETKAVIKHMMKPAKTHSGVYAVCLHDNVLIGTIDIHHITPGFKGELGLVLHPDFHNQGIMSEAGKIMLMIGFEDFQLKRIEYRHFKANKPSARLREKLMFHYEGTLRNGHQMPDGSLKDSMVSAMTDIDYFIRYQALFKSFKSRLKTL